MGHFHVSGLSTVHAGEGREIYVYISCRKVAGETTGRPIARRYRASHVYLSLDRSVSQNSTRTCLGTHTSRVIGFGFVAISCYSVKPK